VAALALRQAMAGAIPPGAAGLGSVGDPLPMLTALADIGIRAAVFEGG
jgi:hypothetical protein